MKTNFTRKIYRKIIIATGAFTLLASFTACSVVESAPSASDKRKNNAAGTKISRKERDVKIYPDLIKRVMHVKNVEEAPLDFFVFDLQGNMVVHYKMGEGERKKVSGLEKGSYVYQVFKGDEMSESGKMIIK